MILLLTPSVECFHNLAQHVMRLMHQFHQCKDILFEIHCLRELSEEKAGGVFFIRFERPVPRIPDLFDIAQQKPNKGKETERG